MTIEQALLKFNVNYDSLASGSAPHYELDEVSRFMNDAMFSIVALLYRGGAIDKLRELIVVQKLSLTPCTIEEFGSYAYQSTPESGSLLYYLASRANVSRTTLSNMSSEWVECIEISRQSIKNFVTNSSHKPIFIKPRIYQHFISATGNVSTILVLFIDKDTTIATTNTLQLTSIKVPTLIDVSGTSSAQLCELNDDIQELIVTEAVKLAMVASDADRLKMVVPQQQQQNQ